jgi:hypothetical protein
VVVDRLEGEVQLEVRVLRLVDRTAEAKRHL